MEQGDAAGRRRSAGRAVTEPVGGPVGEAGLDRGRAGEEDPEQIQRWAVPQPALQPEAEAPQRGDRHRTGGSEQPAPAQPGVQRAVAVDNVRTFVQDERRVGDPPTATQPGMRLVQPDLGATLRPR